MRKVLIEAATQAELLYYVRNVLGVAKAEMPDNTGPEKLKSKIRQIQGSEITEIDAEDLPAPQMSRPGFGGAETDIGEDDPSVDGGKLPTAANGLNDPKVEIFVYDTDDNKGEPIQAAVNGRLMLIPVNKNVIIPYRYLLALQNAQQITYETKQISKDEMETIARTEQRHKVNVIRMPSAAEIEAWEKALNDESARKARAA